MNEYSYFCGVDVAKDSFVVSVRNGRLLIKNRVFAMDRTGFKGFEQTIRGFRPDVVIGMEPTGIYHQNLFNFLVSAGYNSVVVNPYTLHQFFKFTHNKPTKTDKKDSQTIAKVP